jgi:hypothetical protein
LGYIPSAAEVCVPIPVFPDLPEDDPIKALRLIWDYLRAVAIYWSPLKVGAAITVSTVFLLGVAYYFLGLDATLSWAADSVPMAIALVGIIMSYKQIDKDSHFTATVVLVIVGFVGTSILHWSRTREQAAHKIEVAGLLTKLEIVGTQNTQILFALNNAKPSATPQSPQAVELERRENVRKALSGEYILSHDNVSPGLLAGTELPPSDWMNKRLRELGEKWAVTSAMPASKVIAPNIPQSKLAKLQFSFWSDDPVVSFPIKMITVDLHPINAVTFSFTVKNIGEATAQNIDTWIQICDQCSFVREPEGFMRPNGMNNKSLTRTIPRLSVGSNWEKMTCDITVPAYGQFVAVLFKWSCDTCESVEGNVHQEAFLININRPKGAHK